MNIRPLSYLIASLLIAVACAGLLSAAAASPRDSPALPQSYPSSPPLADDPSPPISPVKLVFIHHSSGDNWLNAGNGNLGDQLGANNYYVSDTYYGWGPDSIGDNTDIGHWWTWFRGPNSSTYTHAVYDTTYQHASYTRPMADPGGENEIVMFKSCFPNSNLQGDPEEDPPPIGSNPLRGQSCDSEHHTVANARGIYIDLLEYFATRQDKLFVVITAPPVQDSTWADNARAFNTWLVEDWLDGYPYNNVAVFDFYNVLTSNGGNWYTNDRGWDTGNHHRYRNDVVEYITDQGGNTAAYPDGGSDDHPSAAGNQKATGEFLPLLNVYYHRWKSGAVAPSLTLVAPTGGESWPVDSQQHIRWTTTGSVDQVSLAYSTDGFVTPRVISSPLANTGVYTWTTPPTPTHSAQVRVASIVSPTTVSDTSAAFTLYDPSTFTNTVHLPLVLNNYAPSTPPDGALIQPTDLVYHGAFRLPDSPGTPENVGWEWGGSAMTYYPHGDPQGRSADDYPGSIFGAGHDQTQYISEIGIPTPTISLDKDVNELNTAQTLQHFHDIRGNLYDGRFYDFEIPRAGLAYLPRQGGQTTDKLHFCWGIHMQEGDVGPSHGWCELDLSAPQSAGIWRIGRYWNYVTTDYLFDIPRSWADAYTPGRYLATGRFRDGGQGAQGPSLLAYGPWNEGNPPPPDSTLSAVPLLLYDDVTTPIPRTLNDYHHSDEWSGGVWPTAGDKSAVIFVGTKGHGDCWYGCADGTDEPPWPDDCDRGWWSDTFVGQILFYDPADLAAVARGEMETWEPQPYATLDIDQYLYHIQSTQHKYHVGAASFDRQRGLLYVFEPLADQDRPLIHVWKVEG